MKKSVFSAARKAAEALKGPKSQQEVVYQYWYASVVGYKYNSSLASTGSSRDTPGNFIITSVLINFLGSI